MERRIVSNHQEIEEAIEALEAQRTALGDAVVDTAIATLREQLTQTHPNIEEHEQIVALVADLSGFTAMSELMDAEEVGDTINAVWEILDGVIENWGGKVDKHMGDGLIAFFGVPQGQKDDAERAVLAALEMQMELALFNEHALQSRERSNTPFRPPNRLRMRIGLHMGPVLFGKMGASRHYTAVGDTVSIASRLEELAPLEGILISEDVYHEVRGHFDVQARDPISIEGRAELLRLYVVKRENPRAFRVSTHAVEGIETRMIGRDEQLAQLQFILQETIDARIAQVVTIVGEAGVGKSRLLYEFERWLELLPVQVRLFKGRVYQELGQLPYALIRDMFASYFDIHSRSSATIAREKLVRGIVGVMQEETVRARERAHFMGQLMGFDFSNSPYLQGIAGNARRVRETAFRDMVQFFMAVTEDAPAAVLFLEDIHWADEGSLDLIDYLVQECQDVPLLIVCLAQPSLFAKRPSWQVMESLSIDTYTRIDLPPLSSINSRHLAGEILHNIPQIPLRLTDLIVSGAEGNPFYIEEMIKMLIEEEVIIKGEEQWRVDMGKLANMRVLPTLQSLLQARLDRLPSAEREILQKAAVLGRVFWDTAILHLGQQTPQSLTAEQLEAALQALEQKELVYQRESSAFEEAREYIFKHDSLRDVTYQSLPLLWRQRYHARAAAWFTANAPQNAPTYANVIADHFKLAGDAGQAAEWYGRAGQHAQDTYAPETAIQYYRMALRLLPDNAGTVHQHITFNEGLGEMLRRQARSEEAVEAFHAMQTAAHTLGDQQAEARAFLRCFLTQVYQLDHQAAFHSARQAETAARAANARPYLAMALAAKGWTLLAQGQTDQALALGKEALSLRTSAPVGLATAFSNVLLASVYCHLQRYEQATQFVERALVLFREAGNRMWEGQMINQLGDVARARYDYTVAASHYQDSLRIARDIGDHYGTMLCLKKLSGLAIYQDEWEQAKSYLQQALVLAEKSGNTVYRVRISNDLGDLHLTQAIETAALEKEGHLYAARIYFEQALELAQETDQARLAVPAQTGMARVLVEEGQVAAALAQAKDALSTAQQEIASYPEMFAREELARTWRVLGIVTARLPASMLPVPIGEVTYDATACFAQSLRTFETIERNVAYEKARTLRAWAVFELRAGDKEHGASLWREALATFTRLGMAKEADQMNHFAI